MKTTVWHPSTLAKTVGIELEDDGLYILSWCCTARLSEVRNRIATCSKCSREYEVPVDPRDGIPWQTWYSPLSHGTNSELPHWVADWLGVSVETVEVYVSSSS